MNAGCNVRAEPAPRKTRRAAHLIVRNRPQRFKCVRGLSRGPVAPGFVAHGILPKLLSMAWTPSVCAPLLKRAKFLTWAAKSGDDAVCMRHVVTLDPKLIMCWNTNVRDFSLASTNFDNSRERTFKTSPALKILRLESADTAAKASSHSCP